MTIWLPLFVFEIFYCIYYICQFTIITFVSNVIKPQIIIRPTLVFERILYIAVYVI